MMELLRAVDPQSGEFKAFAWSGAAAVCCAAIAFGFSDWSKNDAALSFLIAPLVFSLVAPVLCGGYLHTWFGVKYFGEGPSPKSAFGRADNKNGGGSFGRFGGAGESEHNFDLLPDLPPSDRCAACGEESETLERCARCKSVFFCSRACQKKAWKSHKAECKENSPVSTPTSSSNGKDVLPSAIEAFRVLADASKALADGDARFARRQAEAGVKLAKKAQLTRQHAEALRILGQACLRSGDEHAAEKAYVAMVALGKDQEDPALEGNGHIGRGCVLRRKAGGGEQTALEHHESAIRLARKFKGQDDDVADAVRSMETEARAQRGSCLLALGRLKDAVEELRQTVKLRKLSLAASDNLERRRRLAVALHNYAGAMRNSPESGGEVAAIPIFREAVVVAKGARDVHTELAAMTSLKEIGLDCFSAAFPSRGESM